MIVRFLNKILIFIAAVLVAFVLICSELKVEPVKVIVEVKQSIDVLRELSNLSNQGNIDIETLFDKLTSFKN